MSCIQLQNAAKKIIDRLNNISVPDNGVVVFDIDNTLVDNSGNPIIPIIRTYHHAHTKGLKTVIVTARVGTPENIEQTRQQLFKYGLDDNVCMYFRPQNNIGDASGQAYFKLKSREDIHRQGYTVVMSIGDMPWDIGEYGGDGHHIPTC